MKSYPIKTEYFTDYDCDFDGGELEAKKIDKTYKYVYSGARYKLLRAFLYRGIATPLAFIWSKLIKREKFIGREKLKEYEGRGFFVYCNHTQAASDAFSPNLFVFPKIGDIVISSKNMALPVLGRLLPYLGGIPVPTSIGALKNFSEAIHSEIEAKRAVIIYPEAHLWPYMKDLRPFAATSFTYPVRLGAPSFALTRVYRRTRSGYRCYLYLDGPFFPDDSLPTREAAEKLLCEIREAMEERCRTSDIEIIRYVKKESKNNENDQASDVRK